MPDSNRIVVIGSGPAGAAAALFASKVGGVEVLVLEAGSEKQRLGFTLRVKGFTVAKYRPQLHARTDLNLVGDPNTHIYEALAPGGLSNHWSCAVPRFSREDFGDAARGGEAYAWPIGYDDLAPWYDRVEPHLCIAASGEETPQIPAGRVAVARGLAPEWQAVAGAARETGRSVVPMPYAYGGSSFLTPSGTSFNAFTRLLAPEIERGTLAFRGDAKVTRLEWAPREQRVVAVITTDAAGRETRIPCRAVVVAAGAINSARLLLASKSGDFPRGLGNEHDVLGRYLHDHPIGKSVIDLGRPVTIHPAAYITRPLLERSAPLLAAAYMQWAGMGPLAKSLLFGRPGKAKQIGFTVFASMVPRPEDRVVLEDERGDGATGGRLALALSHPPEIQTLLEAARDELMAMFQRAGWEPRQSVWLIEPPGLSVHYGGTCRMHASPRYGVVDGWCRVHGVRNVAVADSAVFTTTPEKNPVLTAMTLAARAGDRLAREVASGDL